MSARSPNNRDFKIQRRGRQRERQNNNWFNKPNNNNKNERTQIHFLSDVLVAVASLDRKVPNVGGAVQMDPTLLRYASAITEQKKCWELLAEKFDRFQTLRNNMQLHL